MKASWRVLMSVGAMFLSVAAQVPPTRGPIIEVADSGSATITWSTQQASSGRVWYGEDPDDLTQIAEDATKATEHRVRLEALQGNSTYYFQVDSGSGSVQATSKSQDVLSFRTTAPGQQPIHNRKAVVAQSGISSEVGADVEP
jgi:hypothetical protein